MQLKYLILVSILVASTLAQFDDPTTGGVKLPRLRGLDKIGIGFDIVKMQQLWSPIELTYMGKTITNPYDDNDYEIPMEIASISTPDTFINKTTNVWNTVEEFQTTKGRATGISLNLGNIFAFTNTRETRQIRYTADNRSYRYGVTEQTHIFFEAQLFPPFLLKLSRNAKTMLSKVPRFSEATKAQWFEFFDYFGTHYVKFAQFGGTVRREELANIAEFTRFDEDYVKKQFGISFSFGTTPASTAPWTPGPVNDPTVGVTQGWQIPTRVAVTPASGKRSAEKENRRTREKRDAEQFSFSFYQMREDLQRQLEIRYTESRDVSTRLIGGNPTQYSPENWRDWVESIVDNPVMITYTFGSIADLITDPTVQADMAQAIAARNSMQR
jgi:hypothetical protein